MSLIRARHVASSVVAVVGLMGALAVPASAQTDAPAPAAAPPATPASTGFLANIQLGGLLDGYYDYNSNDPTGDMPFRNFDTKAKEARFSMGEVWAAKTPSSDSRIGFNVHVGAGHAFEMINAAEPSTVGALEHLEQAYVSYLAPVGKGLQIDAGKFVTQHGAEVIEAKDNWNYSRSLLFALAIPYYHAGVRASYTVNDKLAFMGTVVNGWNDVKDNNGGKTVGGQVTVKPAKALTIVQNYMVGPEQAHDTADVRQLFDTIATVTATSKVSVMANYDYGHDTLAGSGVDWQGVAGYLKVQATPWLAIVPRVEVFNDPEGFMTGTSQLMKDTTLTGEFKLPGGVLWRVEYRRDMSDAAVFARPAGDMVQSQNTFGMGVLYSYQFTTK